LRGVVASTKKTLATTWPPEHREDLRNADSPKTLRWTPLPGVHGYQEGALGLETMGEKEAFVPLIG
jgi:hypothetical protein